MLTYPILWVGTSFFCVVQLLSQPFWGLLFVIDKELFVYGDAKESKFEDGHWYPRAGLPTVLAKTFGIYSLLWIDTTYLVDKNDLSLKLDNFVQMYVFGLF